MRAPPFHVGRTPDALEGTRPVRADGDHPRGRWTASPAHLTRTVLDVPFLLPAPDLRHRLPRLLVGLVLFGVGIAFMVRADLGLSPWDVLHQGVAGRTALTIGTVSIITSGCVLLLWIPLRERLGIGTLLNAVLIGLVVDLTLWLVPPVEALPLRLALLAAGPTLVGAGSGFYIGAGLGPGPRDGLMTGLARRGLPVGPVRGGIEVTVLLLGWALGGTVGIGTVVFTLSIGPLVALFLRWFALEDTRRGLAVRRPARAAEVVTDPVA